MYDKRYTEAGELLEIHLLDHIVIGDRCYKLFRKRALHSGERMIINNVFGVDLGTKCGQDLQPSQEPNDN